MRAILRQNGLWCELLLRRLRWLFGQESARRGWTMWWIYVILIMGGLVVLAAAALLPQIFRDGLAARARMDPVEVDQAMANLEAELRKDLAAADAFARDPTPDNLRDSEQDEPEQAWPLA
jgi:hypothetical protein